MTRNSIKLTVTANDLEQIIETYSGEYRNLMELLRDKMYLDSFGECCGMGRCATCIIEINGLKGNVATKERNEPVTLSKFGYKAEDIRLSCQVLISTDLDGSKIKILE